MGSVRDTTRLDRDNMDYKRTPKDGMNIMQELVMIFYFDFHREIILTVLCLPK